MKSSGHQPRLSSRESRLVLGCLVRGNGHDFAGSALNPEVLANWLLHHGLGPLAYRTFRESCPELASLLRPSYQQTAVANLVLFHQFASILPDIHKAGIPIVLLKGAALVGSVYPELSVRPMCDIDVWAKDEDMDSLTNILIEHGFLIRESESRPLEIQVLQKGEIQFHSDRSMIELHWSPFAGWWMHFTTDIDDDEVWNRCRQLTTDFGGLVSTTTPREQLLQLSVEDAIIQIASHIAVSHAFDPNALRGLVDLATIARSQTIDWDVVAARAQKWRLQIPVWTVLSFAHSLIGLPGARDCIESLKPSRLRCFLIDQIVTPQEIIDGRNAVKGRTRFAFLILQVARFRDALRLVAQTIYPERSWMLARYGKRIGRFHHVRNVLLKGEV